MRGLHLPQQPNCCPCVSVSVKDFLNYVLDIDQHHWEKSTFFPKVRLQEEIDALALWSILANTLLFFQKHFLVSGPGRSESIYQST